MGVGLQPVSTLEVERWAFGGVGSVSKHGAPQCPHRETSAHGPRPSAGRSIPRPETRHRDRHPEPDRHPGAAAGPKGWGAGPIVWSAGPNGGEQTSNPERSETELVRAMAFRSIVPLGYDPAIQNVPLVPSLPMGPTAAGCGTTSSGRWTDPSRSTVMTGTRRAGKFDYGPSRNPQPGDVCAVCPGRRVHAGAFGVPVAVPSERARPHRPGGRPGRLRRKRAAGLARPEGRPPDRLRGDVRTGSLQSRGDERGGAAGRGPGFWSPCSTGTTSLRSSPEKNWPRS